MVRFRRRGGFSRLHPVNSNKNVFEFVASPGTTTQVSELVLTKDSPVNTAANEVRRGCSVNSIWLSFDCCGLAGTGVRQVTALYLIKDPGSNLIVPSPLTVGTSNEKKFVIKQWKYMTMRNQDGNPPYHWEGWISIPKGYQRMGADDKLTLVFITDTSVGHLTGQAIYKWFT